ncbi:MAG: HAMP domain-containing histidine kinase, partial [Bacteroidota bacterium]|nr:HAMP domain-containing histidine kinase [Bacteroidota bacterium]
VEMCKEMEELNRRLIKAEKMKSSFLSNIRNEINNPLTAILGFSGNIMSGAIKGEDLTKYSSHIYQEAFNLDYQLKNIFAAAEIEAGEVIPHAAEINIYEFVKEQVRYLEPRIRLRNIAIIINVDEEATVFNTDATILQTILVNLLANAIEFSPMGEQVKVHGKIQGGNLVLTVEDKGPGMSEHEQKYIFERFHQLEEGPTKKHPGHGLGLSIVKEMIDISKGNIYVVSNKNEGTCITVNLPAFSALSPESDHLKPDGCTLFGEEELL